MPPLFCTVLTIQLADCRSAHVRREQLRYVITTHVHLDHAGGGGQLMEYFPEATLLIHPRGVRDMINPRRLVASSEQVYGKEAFARLYGEVLTIPETRVRSMEAAGGQDFDVAVEAIREITRNESGRLVDEERAHAAVKSPEANAQLNAQGVTFLSQVQSRAFPESLV